MRTTLTTGIAALTLVLATSAQAEPIMCKNPKVYVCNVDGCVLDLGSTHNKDVIILDIAENVVTTCFGKDGKCEKTTFSVETGAGGHFISGPARALRLIDNELTQAVTVKRNIVAQFFQCAKP